MSTSRWLPRPFISLRYQILALVLLTILPLAGLALLNAAEQRRAALEQARQNAVNLARLGSESQLRVVTTARDLLRTLAEVEILRSDAAACNALLHSLFAERPEYSVVGVADLQGNVRCASLPPSGPVNYADRDWFQKVVQTRRAAVGHFVIGRISGRPVLPLAYPLMDERERLVGVVFLGIDLQPASQMFATLDLPPGSTVTLLDPAGTVLARYPFEEGQWIGKSVADLSLVQTILSHPGSGYTEDLGPDGVKRIYGFTPVTLDDQPWGYLMVGMDEKEVYRVVGQIFRTNLLRGGVVILLALVGAWLFGERLMLRRVYHLVTAVQRLAEGDFSARTELPGGGDEIGYLARAFNAMTEALAERERARQQALAALQEREATLRHAQAIAHVGSWTLDLTTRQVTWSEEMYCIFQLPPHTPIHEHTFLEFVLPEDRPQVETAWRSALAGAPYNVEARIRVGDEIRWVYDWAEIERDTQGNPRRVLGVTQDITALKEAQLRVEQQLQTLSALYEGSRQLALSLDLDEVARNVMRAAVEIFGARLAWVGLAELDGTMRVLGWYPPDAPYLEHIRVRWDETPEGMGPTGRAIRSGQPVVIEDIATAPEMRVWHEAARAAGFVTSAAFPLATRGHFVGALNVYSDRRGFFTPERREMFQAFAHQAAAALENARLFEETNRRLARIQALRRIDLAISSTLDARVAFNVALNEITTQLGVDAACILLLDPHTRTLDFAAGRGFRTPALRQTHLPWGQGYAGRAAAERRILRIDNLAEHKTDFLRSPHFAAEGFVTYYAVPLIAEGQVRGVLELFHRAPLQPDAEWQEFLDILAGQVALAIENMRLFRELQESNQALLQAYDATIEGWSYALDLRDKETEGHTQRVTELTLRLARALGINGEALVHIRRGALLHDIGKMGVPDSILHKPGPLTPDEWVIMRQHPVLAYEMLSRIEYLRPALDIPYCHHEKWDGTGYPRGLKGEEIPLAARIFAVVDVWDALTSDRPYRPAWTREQAVAYLREQAGKHFDPRIVEIFLREVLGETE
jgi:putative nucleotidyltransferase with HDIG domain